ncbi:MAG: HTH-type transcriptional regulator MhqR [Pseudomonadota bacterium]|jgi:DNA-binding MarR family transcriptional regulator
MATSSKTSHQPSNQDLLVADTVEQGAFFDLVRVASRLEGELNRVFRPYDLTTATFSILSILERVSPEGLSCGDVAGQLIAEVPDMTRLLDRLERLEYVLRERSSLDRRMVKVRLTERGLEVVRNLKSAVQRCHKEQFKSLAPEGLEQLRGMLRELARDERIGFSAGEEHQPPPRQVGAGSS